MFRYILTGAPGAGKTSVLRWLDQAGFALVEEAATDLIALDQAAGIDAPWQDSQFIDRIVSLRRRRQEAVEASVPAVIFDRSPICTLALARFLGRRASEILRRELARIVDERVYERRVLFVRASVSSEPPPFAASAWTMRWTSSGCTKTHIASSISSWWMCHPARSRSVVPSCSRRSGTSRHLGGEALDRLGESLLHGPADDREDHRA